MAGGTFDNLAEALRAIKRDVRKKERSVTGILRRAARETAKVVQMRVPRAFGELADSIHVEVGDKEARIIADAPHAGAVETGSRPHTPPLEPLIHWVELRGMQGLSSSGGIRKITERRWKSAANIGGGMVHSLQMAQVIARTLRQKLGAKGAAAWRERAALGSVARSELGADPATVAVARAIQMSIKKRGTKPYRFMAGAVPYAEQMLDRLAREALYQD